MTALIVVIGVMTGMQTELRDKILGSNPHVVIRQRGPSLRLEGADEVSRTALLAEGVVAAEPIILSRVGLMHAGYSEVLDLYGFDMKLEGEAVMPVAERIRDAWSAFQGEDPEATPLILGSAIADQMGVRRGDDLAVVALENVQLGPFGELAPKMDQWRVAGSFSTGMHAFDQQNGYAAIEDVRRLLGIAPDAAAFVGVRADDPWRAEEVAAELRDALDPARYRIDAWTQTNRQFFSALRLEKLAMGVILSLIVLVSAFNIVSALVMVVASRTREIGILKAMGLTRRATLAVFILQGIWIGAIGTLSGVLLGLGIGHLIEEYGLVPIPPDIYFVDRLPVRVGATDILWISGVSMLISFAATIYPAYRASRLLPVEAIRHE